MKKEKKDKFQLKYKQRPEKEWLLVMIKKRINKLV